MLANGHHNLYTRSCVSGEGRAEGKKTCELTSSANVADTCNVSAALLKSRLTGQKKLAKATARRRRRRRSFVLLAPHHCVHSVVGSDVLVRRSYSIVASSRKEQKSLARLYFYILLGNASCFSELNMLLQRIQSCGSHKLVCCVGLFNLWLVDLTFRHFLNASFVLLSRRFFGESETV